MKSHVCAIISLSILFFISPAVFSEENTNDSHFYFSRGQKYFREMQYEKALAEYKRAVEIEPQNDSFYKAVIEIFDHLDNNVEKWRYTALYNSAKGHYDKALLFYNKILSINNKDIGVLNAIGNIYCWQKSYTKALIYFNNSLKIRVSAEALLGKGDVYFNKNMTNWAVKQYKKVLLVEPYNKLAHQRLAEAYDKTGIYKEALNEYKYALKSKWNDTAIWSRIGWIYEINGDFNMAQYCYNKAIEFDAEFLDAMNGLGRIKAVSGDYIGSATYFERALKKSNYLKNAETLNGLGWLYAWQADYQKAIKYFYRAQGVDETNLEAKTGIGWIYSRKGEYDKALELYKNTSDLASLNGTAWVLARQGKYDDAIKIYKDILKKSPQNIEAFNGLGWIYLRLGDMESSRRFYEKSIKIQIYNPEAYYGEAQILEKRGQFKNAIEYYKKAIGYNILCIPYKEALAHCYFKSKEYKDSLKLLEQFIGPDIRNEENQNTMAICYFNLGQFEKAKECYKRILGTNPKSLDAIIGLAEINLKDENYDSAMESFNKILAMDPNNRIAHKGLAHIYKTKNVYNKAIEEYKKLILLKCNDVESWNNLGWVYFQRKDYDKAIESYEKGLSFIRYNTDGLLGLNQVYLETLDNSTSENEKGKYIKKVFNNSKKILARNHHYSDALLNLSKAYVSTKDFKKAHNILLSGVQDYEILLKKSPNSKRLLTEKLRIEKELFLVRIREKKGYTKDDRKYLVRLTYQYKKLLKFKINDTQLWLDLASLYKICGLYGEAEQFLNTAMKFSDEKSSQIIMLHLAEIYIMTNRIEKAKAIYDVFLTKHLEDNSETYLGLGKVYELKNDLHNAIIYYQKAMTEKNIKDAEDYKAARLGLARSLAKKDFLNKSICVYKEGFIKKPYDEEYNLKAHKELGEIYMKMKLFGESKKYYQKCLEMDNSDIDSLIALADIERGKGNYNEAKKRYKEALKQDPDNFYVHNMLGNIYSWTRNWREAEEEYKLASSALAANKGKPKNEEDEQRFKKSSSSSIISRFKYSESKEDDAGKKNYVVQTDAWDVGLKCTEVIKNWFSIIAGYDHASSKEKFITGAQVDSYIDSDVKTIGFEYHPVEKIAIEGLYNNWNYQNHNDDISAQRVPLRSDKQFDEENIDIKYDLGRGNVELKGSKEPLPVKIFIDNPETDIYTKYNVLLGLGNYLTDIIKLNANCSANLYSPAHISKYLYQANVTWELYKHNFSVYNAKEDLPFSSFERAAGFSVLDKNVTGVSYVNNWIKNITINTDFKNEYYSDKNTGHLFNAGASIVVPHYEKFNLSYNFKYEDYKFTAESVEGEPLYLSPQNLSLNSVSITYKDDITKNISYALGYTYTLSSERKEGNGVFIRTTYKLTDSASIHLEVETTDDASFTKEQKALIYLTKCFF